MGKILDICCSLFLPLGSQLFHACLPGLLATPEATTTGDLLAMRAGQLLRALPEEAAERVPLRRKQVFLESLATIKRAVAAGDWPRLGDALATVDADALHYYDGDALLADARALDVEALLGEAAALVATTRPNRLGSAVTLANPWEPRKRFSHAWIVAPCLLILALPYLYTWCAGLGLRAAERRYRAEAAQYLPLEKATEAAQKRKDAAQRAYDAERATQQALAARRLPLAAFVQAAYFFCRHAGQTVILTGLTEHDGIVTATGTCTDQEDDLALNNALTAFAEAEGLRIASYSRETGKDDEGLPLTRFVYTIDCTRMGDAQ